MKLQRIAINITVPNPEVTVKIVFDVQLKKGQDISVAEMRKVIDETGTKLAATLPELSKIRHSILPVG